MIVHSHLRSFAVLGMIALLIGLAIAPSGATPAQAQTRRPVMAFYYPWYERADWENGKMSDVASPKYNGGDDATLLRHIQQADDAGIDALICTWYGPKEERLDKRCRRLLKLVEQSGRNIKVAIIPDQSAAFDAGMRTVDGLVAALDVLRRDFTSSPAYFRFQGKPAVYWFNPPSLGGVDAWQQLRGRADPNHDQFWYGGTDNFGYLDVYDALYYFDITWERAPGAAMASYAGRLANYNKAHPGANKPFIGTVMPGYDDLKVRNGHQRDRANGEYYRGTWQTVIDRNAEAVILTSFNEFYEGSHIEPSANYGDLYLRLTKELSDRFHSAQAPAPAATPLPPNPAAGPCQNFPETGFQVCGRILEYWNQNGGLPVFGYPIGAQAAEQVEGTTVQSQQFERNRLELHPENQAPYDVLLGRLGAASLEKQGRNWQTFGKADAGAAHYFAETGHAIAPQFWAYWSSHGLEFDGRRGKSFNESLALFGLPLSEATVETNPTNGQQYLTQHFERARFEYHPENQPPYDVLLGLLGRELSGKP